MPDTQPKKNPADFKPSMVPPMKKRPSGPELPHIDVYEYGAKRGDVQQKMNERLFMQLLVFDAPVVADAGAYVEALGKAVDEAKVPSVIYEDVQDPRGIGLLTWSTDPAHFVTTVRPLFRHEPLRDLHHRRDFAMIGRSYGLGYEQNLQFWLLEKPVQNVLGEKNVWAVWYPLRRSGAFEKLDHAERRAILGEHGTIGRAYGAQGLGSDVRLACHGLDANDNEYLIGLIGEELHPLSHLVQTMRGTRQTSEFIQEMGPFFVGHVAHRQKG